MMKWINKKRNQKGFTLIELVVVIAILGILAAIAIPRLGGFQESAKLRTAEANHKLIVNAINVYYSENSKWPTQNSHIEGYLNDTITKMQTDTGAKHTLSMTGIAGGTLTTDLTGIKAGTPDLVYNSN